MLVVMMTYCDVYAEWNVKCIVSIAHITLSSSSLYYDIFRTYYIVIMCDGNVIFFCDTGASNSA